MNFRSLQNSAQLLPYGPKAFLIQGGSLDQRHAWTVAIDSSKLPHFEEWIMGYDSLLLKFKEPADANEFLPFLKGIPESAAKSKPSKHLIELNYDGPDLQRVAEHTGLEVAEVIRRHSQATYRVRLLGFAPGFAYLDGLPCELHCPRLDSPRPRVRAGAVAIGGSHAGVYPSDTPGGWNWIGTTDKQQLLPRRADHPFLLAPGDIVTFKPR